MKTEILLPQVSHSAAPAVVLFLGCLQCLIPLPLLQLPCCPCPLNVVLMYAVGRQHAVQTVLETYSSRRPVVRRPLAWRHGRHQAFQNVILVTVTKRIQALQYTAYIYVRHLCIACVYIHHRVQRQTFPRNCCMHISPKYQTIYNN